MKLVTARRIILPFKKLGLVAAVDIYPMERVRTSAWPEMILFMNPPNGLSECADTVTLQDAGLIIYGERKTVEFLIKRLKK
jgi:hypothetical protein